jgi:amino acid permease
MSPKIFDIFKNENLPKPLLIIKRLGSAVMALCLVGVGMIQFTQDEDHSTEVYNILYSLVAWSFFVSVLCFAAIAITTVGKTKNTSIMQSVGNTMSKVFLYMFLPAILLTIVLIVVFTLPRYL